jgi:hypothetical protein
VSWNYRLTVETVDDEEVWALREIYYDDDGNVTLWSQDPVGAVGDSWMECADTLARMAAVIGYPAYDLDARCWVDHKRRPKEQKGKIGRDPGPSGSLRG